MKWLSDRPVVIILAMLIFYWAVFPLVPRPKGANAVAIGAMCAGIFVVWQYVETTFEILFRKERAKGWIAVLCVSGVGYGMLVGGAYRLVWNGYDQPQEWISTATSTFGNAILMVSVFGLGLSHTLTKISGVYPSSFWRSVLVAMAIVIAFIVGQNFS